jgi:leukotriene A-4 hydrolase/aminopeptidase
MRVLTSLLLATLAGLPADPGTAVRDSHSLSRPDEVRVVHLDLELNVDFETKVLHGSATWTIQRQPNCPDDADLILDTRGLTIEGVEAQTGEGTRPTTFELGPVDKVLGQLLCIDLPSGTGRVRVRYRTAPEASALQWVDPAGTTGKKHPFLYTQSQAIHARSWIPCQDTPGVRFTYRASVSVPADQSMTVVMAAEGLARNADAAGPWNFRMDQPIPSYLLALAVGDLAFQSMGKRTGVWAEPAIVEKAAWEFADTEKMVEAAEKRFGPYRWERYDILVLPPSFPYGGMENPRLTFATPTVLAGDRSQVALIAHELAHSWSGNLVTNATWRDFWLNEGFTVFLERRIVADVFGPVRAGMEAVLGDGELRAELARLAPRDQVLHVDLNGRDPDEGFTRVPYEKGAAFLGALEARIGPDLLDEFLKDYFDHFAFQSIDTAEFEAYLKRTLFPDGQVPLNLEAWIHEPGLPADAPRPTSDRFTEIERLAASWISRATTASSLPTKHWTTLEWLHFLRSLPENLTAERLEELDGHFDLTHSGNAEIACQWLEMAIRAGYHRADGRLVEFLGSVGRRKFLIPLYTALAKSPGGRERARSIFARSRAAYHPIAVTSIERLLQGK